jgi:putative DNA primase/helicase
MSPTSFFDATATGQQHANGDQEAAVGRAAVVMNAATISPESMLWLWPGRIAVGALTNTVGNPDQGKTLLYCDLTGRLTAGSPMPPAPHRAGATTPQRVLILTLEDSLGTTIVPRLLKARADLALVDFVQMVRNADGELSVLTLAEDIDVLDATLSAQRYGLVVVDGIAGYLGDAKTHNDAEVRRVLTPFVHLLDRQKVAGLSVMHPAKSTPNLAYYAGGSVAFTNVPRVALGVAKDPNDESENPRRLLLKLKGNLYGAVPTLAYRIVADDPAAVPSVEWEPNAVDVAIADVLDPVKETPEDRGTLRGCVEWLNTYLADGPRPSTDVEKAATAAGWKARTLRRAREKVVDSVKVGRPGQSQQWEWRLR